MREAQVKQFVAGSKWGAWQQIPIAGDASARRYTRLTHPDYPAVILMDDPNGDTQRFADIATFLNDAGFAAPLIHLHAADLGLMIISDLGPTDFANHLRTNARDEQMLYTSATDVLSLLHTHKTTLPLGAINQDTAADMIDLAALHYAPTPAHKDDLNLAMKQAYAAHVDTTPHVSLRDFHAENLIWRAQAVGNARVGLLDFQDACFAPAGYDLMSLVRDARRDVKTDIANACIAKFCTSIGKRPQDMSAHLACISAQRNLRILGIFARLAQQNGKLKYLSLLPRVWGHLMTDLAHPALFELRSAVQIALPPPDAATLQRLQP